jgi:hypothetical protein
VLTNRDCATVHEAGCDNTVHVAKQPQVGAVLVFCELQAHGDQLFATGCFPDGAAATAV